VNECKPLLSGRREAYFGETMRDAARRARREASQRAAAPGGVHPGVGHVVRYEGTFEVRGGDGANRSGAGAGTRVGGVGGPAAGGVGGGEEEQWLVFRDEGESLQKLMYTSSADGDGEEEEGEGGGDGPGGFGGGGGKRTAGGPRAASGGGSGLRVVRPSRW
jgi:hypothetical protein